jgi:predicted kinase
LVDAVHGRGEQRAALEALAGECGVRFDGLWLEAPVERLVERVRARDGDASDADERVVRAQLTRDTGSIGWRRLDAGVTAERLVERARAALELDRGALAEVW